MNTRKFFFRLCVLIAPLVTALALGGPVTPAAAATTIVIDSTTVALGCGDYTAESAQTNLVTAVLNATDNTTIVVCPGTYTLTDFIHLYNKDKVTIKAAVADPNKRPVLKIASGESFILQVSNAQNTTIDGLIFDGQDNTETSFNGIAIAASKAVIKNIMVIGPTGGTSRSLSLNATLDPTVYSVSVSNSYFAGYDNQAIDAFGAVKLSVTSSYFDSTDGGRLPSTAIEAIRFLNYDDLAPTGSVTKSQILNNSTAITINGASKVSVTNNMMSHNVHGVDVLTDSSRPNVANTKITGNQILYARVGIDVHNYDAANKSITKTTISKNLLTSEQFGLYTGIRVEADTLAGANVTGTISNNTLMGFGPAGWIVFDLASMTSSKNTVLP